MTEIFTPGSDYLHNRHSPVTNADRFLETQEIRDLIRRASMYLDAAVPIHFRGPAGTGKTSIAHRIASLRNRPISLINGHEWLTSEDFVGKEIGHSETSVIDKYIQSVRRRETKVRADWRDSILAEAMEQGRTLIYDEFTRSSPEANVTFLSVLEEGLLISTDRASKRDFIRAHPEFRIILTSNPSDYVGVNTAPDALLDRMVTFDLQGYTRDTEAHIVRVLSGLDETVSNQIVSVVHRVRSSGLLPLPPSMRTTLLIARIAAFKAKKAGLSRASLAAIAFDVISGRSPETDREALLSLLEATSLNEKEVG